MLSIQGLICKDLKRQNKLPEKWNDIVLDPKYTRIGKCYNGDGSEITDWTVAPAGVFTLISPLGTSLPFNLIELPWELTYFHTAFNPSSDASAFVLNRPTYSSNGSYVLTSAKYYTRQKDVYVAVGSNYDSTSIQFCTNRNTVYIAMGSYGSKVYSKAQKNMTEWQALSNWPTAEADKSLWEAYVHYSKSSVGSWESKDWTGGCIYFNANFNSSKYNLIPDNIKLVVDGQVVFKGKNRI